MVVPPLQADPADSDRFAAGGDSPHIHTRMRIKPAGIVMHSLAKAVIAGAGRNRM
jgi:hypothetical protein